MKITCMNMEVQLAVMKLSFYFKVSEPYFDHVD